MDGIALSDGEGQGKRAPSRLIRRGRLARDGVAEVRADPGLVSGDQRNTPS